MVDVLGVLCVLCSTRLTHFLSSCILPLLLVPVGPSCCSCIVPVPLARTSDVSAWTVGSPRAKYCLCNFVSGLLSLLLMMLMLKRTPIYHFGALACLTTKHTQKGITRLSVHRVVFVTGCVHARSLGGIFFHSNANSFPLLRGETAICQSDEPDADVVVPHSKHPEHL